MNFYEMSYAVVQLEENSTEPLLKHEMKPFLRAYFSQLQTSHKYHFVLRKIPSLACEKRHEKNNAFVNSCAF